MKSTLCLLRTAAVAWLASGVSASTAAAQDADAMEKWTSLTVVRYKVVGEHTGQAPLLTFGSIKRNAQVTDRVEFDLDWNQQTFTMAGTPTIRNFPSRLGNVAPVANCPAPRVDGAFELWTLQAVKGDGPMAMAGILTLQGKKDSPAGAIPTINELGCQQWNAVAAKSEPVEINFTLPPAMMLAMPGGAFAVSPDGKSLVFQAAGWTWTCTPTPVK